MDQRQFDRLARLLGGATDRRAGLKAAFGALLGAGGAAAALELDAEAKKRGKDTGRKGAAGPDAEKRKKRKKSCKPACEGGFVCQKVDGAHQCVCETGVACGAACCAAGQTCQGGQCAAEPQPTTCIAYGEPCKNVGKRCCDGLACGSGHGGSFPVACWKAAGATCTSAAECGYGHDCVAGACTVIPQPSACVAESGSCANGETCCDGLSCDASSKTCVRAAQCAPKGGKCAGDADCCNGEICGADGVCGSGVKACTATVATFADLQAALATASTNSATAPQVICVKPSNDPYDFTATLTGTSKSANNTITIRKDGTGTVTFNGMSSWGTEAQVPTNPNPDNIGGRRILSLESDNGCKNGPCAGFVFDGIDFKNGNAGSGSTDGGCISAYVNLTIKNANFSRCAAGYDGGAVYQSYAGTAGSTKLSLQNSTLQDCYSGQRGGAVVVSDANLAMATVTIKGNVAGNKGGGVFVNADDAVSLDNVTMSGNVVNSTSAGDGGSGLALKFATATLTCVNQGATSIDNGASDAKDCFLDKTSPAAATFFNSCGCATTKNGTA